MFKENQPIASKFVNEVGKVNLALFILVSYG